MQWKITSNLYRPWTDFILEIKDSIFLQTGSSYHLKGSNGTGKTSFIRKVLIPYLLEHPYQQYILYIEQQVQSQFDAVKSYSVFRKHPVKLTNAHDMVTYQMKLVTEKWKLEHRPVIVILDEIKDGDFITNWLKQITLNDICLLYVSHKDTIYDDRLFMHQIDFVSKNISNSKVTYHESNI